MQNLIGHKGSKQLLWAIFHTLAHIATCDVELDKDRHSWPPIVSRYYHKSAHLKLDVVEEWLVIVLDDEEKLVGDADALTCMSKDVVKSETLRLRLVLLIYKYAKTPELL